MTSVEAPAPADETAVLEPAPADALSPEPTAPGKRPKVSEVLGRSLSAPLVVLLVLAIVIAAFEVGVTAIWYQARQHKLATDFAVGRAHLSPGDAAAVLQIPRLGVNLYVVEGDTVAQLRSGPGHRPGTPLPGKLGNSVIVGHRKGWGHPFERLDELRPRQDVIVVRIRGQEPTLFVVRSKHHVSGDDTSLLRPSTDHRLTLVTGDGGLLSDDRLVVTAVSGTVGRLRDRPAPGDPSEPFPLLTPEVGLLVLAFVLAWAALNYLRRRYGTWATVAVAGPLVVAGLVCLLLAIDLVLAPLR